MMRLAKLKKIYKQNPTQTILYGLLVCLAAFPIVVLLGLLIIYSVNVLWWDQMSLVPLMTKLHNGTLNFYDLWVQHNEHRILVPQAAEIVVGQITGFNIRAYVMMNFAAALASFFLMLSLLKQTFGRYKAVILLSVPFAWILFSPIQSVNWIWGFQFAFYLCVLSTVLTIWLLVREKGITSNRLFVAALAVAVATTYCNGNGALIWPIGLAILLWRKAPRARLLQWSIVGLAAIAGYLYKFQRPAGAPHLSTVAREPIAVVKYVLAYLGKSFATSPTAGRMMGATLLILLFSATWYVYKQGKMNKIISWLALASYVIITAFLAAASRLNFGIDHGFRSDSYPTISVIFVVATIAVVAYAGSLWLQAFNKKQLGSYLAAFFAAGVLCGLAMVPYYQNYRNGGANIKFLGTHFKQVQACTYNVSSPNDECLLLIYPDKQMAWDYVQQLKALGWGDFK